MDKETLSNYGWIVIAVLVLVVMIALATPFGKYISNAVQSTTQGLFDVNQNALNAAGVPGLTVQDQEFDVPDMNHGAETPVPVAPGATFNMQTTDGCTCMEEGYILHVCWVTIDPVTLTWDELKLEENGTKYGYDASAITDTTLGDYAFYFCESLESIDIPDSITTIGDSAFRKCTSLESIDLSGCTNLTTLGNDAFSDCTSLKSITLPEGITTLGEMVFCCCYSLTSINIPDSVTTIGKSAFEDCSSLTSVDLSRCTNLTTIEYYAFVVCYSLESITLPSSVTTIGEGAFSGCESLTSITFEGTKAQWDAIGYTAPSGVTVNCKG